MAVMGRRKPDWDLDSLMGELGEDRTQWFRRQVLMGNAEVKADARALDTGNLYVEHAAVYATDGAYHPSGIATTKAAVWVQMPTEDFGVFFSVPLLRALLRAEWLNPDSRKECVHGDRPTRGITLPWKPLLEMVDVFSDNRFEREQ